MTPPTDSAAPRADWQPRGREVNPGTVGVRPEGPSAALAEAEQRGGRWQLSVWRGEHCLIDRSSHSDGPDLFWTWSVSKPFIALLVWQLVERGVIDVATWSAVGLPLPEFRVLAGRDRPPGHRARTARADGRADLRSPGHARQPSRSARIPARSGGPGGGGGPRTMGRHSPAQLAGGPPSGDPVRGSVVDRRRSGPFLPGDAGRW